MITYKTGDIFAEDVEALVNPVNCVGIMDKGLALQFKQRFPQNFTAYAAACTRREMTPGSVFVFETQQLMNPQYIVNIATKGHWREDSKIDDIDWGLTRLVGEIFTRKIKSIAIPALGSGLGRLDWLKVKLLINQVLGPLEDRHIVVFEPLN